MKEILRNPASGFTYDISVTLPNGLTGDTINIMFTTIADNASIVPPNGYVVDVRTSFTDANFTVNILSITRFSNSIKN